MAFETKGMQAAASEQVPPDLMRAMLAQMMQAALQTEFDRRFARFRFLDFRLGPFFDAGRTGGEGRRFAPAGWLIDAGAQIKMTVAGGLTWLFVYGRDLRAGHAVFYTSVRY